MSSRLIEVFLLQGKKAQAEERLSNHTTVETWTTRASTPVGMKTGMLGWMKMNSTVTIARFSVRRWLGEEAPAQITITDTGIGITPEFLPHVCRSG